MYNTEPRNHPLKRDIYNKIILFENGELVKFRSFYDDPTSFSLTDICMTDSIKHIMFYNYNLILNNYSGGGWEHLLDKEYYFTLVISPSKCCKLDTAFNFLFEFGNTGPDNERLIKAVSGDLNYEGKSYVVDTGDNTVKVFDINGNFLTRWLEIGQPTFLKIYDGRVHILDKSSDSIKMYDFNGNYLGLLFNLPQLRDLIAFDFEFDRHVWVIDNGGERINAIEFSKNEIWEEKTDYCYKDVTFIFKRIVSIDVANGGFSVADYEDNYILSFTRGRID